VKRIFTPPTRLQGWDAICDQKSQDLFNAIATNGSEENLLACLKITCKRYYTRISKLVKADLIKRVRGKYGLTAFGKVVYGVLHHMDSKYLVISVWIDYLALPQGSTVQITDRTKVADSLIVDDKIKHILLQPEIS